MSNRSRSPSPGAANSSSTTKRPVSSSSSISYSSDMTYESSCLQPTKAKESVEHSAPITKAMPLVGCPRCLMYVMLSEKDPKCPICKSATFLGFFADEKFMKSTDN